MSTKEQIPDKGNRVILQYVVIAVFFFLVAWFIASRVPRSAGGQLPLFQHDHIFLAQFGQVISCITADAAATNNDSLGLSGECVCFRIVTHIIANSF